MFSVELISNREFMSNEFLKNLFRRLNEEREHMEWCDVLKGINDNFFNHAKKLFYDYSVHCVGCIIEFEVEKRVKAIKETLDSMVFEARESHEEVQPTTTAEPEQRVFHTEASKNEPPSNKEATLNKKQLFSKYKVLEEVPRSFPEALVYYMKERGVTVEELSTQSSVDTRTISRLRNELSRTPKIETIIAICIGLHLAPRQSEYLLDLIGYSIKNSPREDYMLYDIVLTSLFEKSIEVCNNFLMDYGVQPLKA